MSYSFLKYFYIICIITVTVGKEVNITNDLNCLFSTFISWWESFSLQVAWQPSSVYTFYEFIHLWIRDDQGAEYGYRLLSLSSAWPPTNAGFELQEIGKQVGKPISGKFPKSQALKAAGTTIII